MLNIYCGRESVDKQKFIVDNLKGHALIIVPDQFTLEAEQEIFDSLGAKALMNIEVISFSRLGFRLISELGGARRTFIDKYGRHMLLAGIASEEKENLRVFKGLESKNSFIELVNNFISELKQNGCGVEELRQLADEVEADSYIHGKLMDLELLYSRYEERIQGRYTDSEDYIDLFLGKISSSEMIKGSEIWVYGFDSFAPKAMSVLGELICCADEVNVVMSCSENKNDRDYELFELSRRVVANLVSMAEARGVKAERREIPPDYIFEYKNPAILHIEKEIYSLPCEIAGRNESDGITLLAAANLYNEAESAASYVLDLVRKKGLRYNDIKIICNDMEKRGSILKRVFREYGLELFSDSGKDILQNPIIRYVIALMRAVADKYRTEDVFSVIKSGFCNLTADEACDLENYAIKYRIRGSMWKKHFIKGESEYGSDELGRLEELRQRAVSPLIEFEKIVKAQTCREFIESFYRYLYEEACLPQKLAEFVNEQTEGGRHDLAEETAQVWDSLVGILDQMSEINGEQKFEVSSFLSLFETGLSQVEIGVLPPTVDGLVMGTMQRSRTGCIRALIVIGANEGVLPQEKISSGIFASEEKELFSSRGIELCKVDSVRLLEERMGIYRNLSKPTDYLYMSYSAADEEGNALRPSSIFNKLAELFPEVEVKKDIISSGDVRSLINSSLSGLRHLTGALWEAAEGKPLAEDWHEMLNWLKMNNSESLETIERGFTFTNKQEKLGAAAAEQLFKKDIRNDYALSPSRLEKFSRCPFSHFVSYGLNPQERRIFEIAPREIGDIYHNCLMEAARYLTQEGVPVTSPESRWMTVTQEECDRLVEEIIEKQADSYRDGLLHLGNEENYRRERIISVCKKIVNVLIQQVRCGIIESCSFEVPFGRQGAISPICIDLEGKKIYIEGKIDRVDFLAGDRVKIIDYKTGNENFSIEEAEAGYRLQLMLYLEAAIEKERKPAGIFYMNLSEPMIDMSAKKIDDERIAADIRKNFKLNGLIADDAQVISSVAGDFSGYSEILPLYKNKEGTVRATGRDSLISDEDFELLRETVTAKVREICRELVNGDIEIHPMKTKERSACTYCIYKGICRFDTSLDGCGYNLI